ncbi:MAG: hypothetical protein R3257_04045 [bacterium]|nr:hypothetical protein [bacterium]
MSQKCKIIGIISLWFFLFFLSPSLFAHEGDPGHNPGDEEPPNNSVNQVISEGPLKGGKLKLVGRGFRPGSQSTTDVWAHEGFAYLGTFNFPCGDGSGANGSGIRIFDYRNIQDKIVPEVGVIPSVPGSRSNDVKVAAMSSGDILVHSNEWCAPGGVGGFEIWNVDDPLEPIFLAHVQTDDSNHYLRETVNYKDFGVHNLFLFRRGDRDYVAAAVLSGFGNFQIFDITEPGNPQRVGSWGAEEIRMAELGIFQEPELIEDPSLIDQLLDWLWFEGIGFFGNRRLHDVTINEDGTRAYLSYWDAGLILLDISDVTSPELISVALDLENKDGEVNSHSAWPNHEENIVVEGNEDFYVTTTPLNPFDFELPITLRWEATDAVSYTVSMENSNYDSELGADTGLGLDASVPIPFAAGFPYLGTIHSQVFVNTAGTLTFGGGIVQFLPSVEAFIQGPPRIAPWWADLDPRFSGGVHAADKGDRLVITWHEVPYYERNDGTASTFQVVLHADGSIEMNYQEIADPKTLVTLIGVAVGDPNGGTHEVDFSGELPPALSATVLEQFSSVGPSPWGGIRIWDYSDPVNPLLASNFDTHCSAHPGAAECHPEGNYSVHNMIVEGDKAYVAWYGNGVLILDISDPHHPVELARYNPTGEDFELQNNGLQNVWGIYKIPGEPLIFTSDRNGGLYILEEAGKFKKPRPGKK